MLNIPEEIEIQPRVSFLLLLSQLPQTLWLETTEIYYLTDLEGRILERVSLSSSQGVSRTALLLEALERSPFLASSSF